MDNAFPHPSLSWDSDVTAELSIVLISPGYEAPGVTLAKLAIKDIISLIYHRQKAQKTPGNYSRGL
jgi:hypothetical protein